MYIAGHLILVEKSRKCLLFEHDYIVNLIYFFQKIRYKGCYTIVILVQTSGKHFVGVLWGNFSSYNSVIYEVIFQKITNIDRYTSVNLVHINQPICTFFRHQYSVNLKKSISKIKFVLPVV